MTGLESGCIRLEDLAKQVIGADERVPVIGGEKRRYVNFDNAASTPTFQCVWDKLHEFMRWYSNVHRGTGFKSQLATWAFDKVREKVLKFVGATPDEYVVIFGKNASEMINRLASRLAPRDGRDVVLTSVMEHHSNDLPWRRRWKAVHVEVDEWGAIDEEDLKRKLDEYGPRLRLLAISGASNVSGIVNPVHKYARWAHEVGAEILVDGAQLIPHRKVEMVRDIPAETIDYLAFSAHKVYAPFGIGVLVGRKENFLAGAPEHVGGGTIDIVTLDEVEWTDPPEKEEAGTPNIPGAVALGIVIDLLMEIGMDRVAEHERELTDRAVQGLKRYPDVIIYGPENGDRWDRLGVITFNVKGIPHGKLAAMLSWEAAIGVRNGCFCAHPYVTRLLKVSREQMREAIAGIRSGDRSMLPGAVRISFGCYNTVEEVDYFLESLDKILKGEIRGEYEQIRQTGEYRPKNFAVNFEEYFPW
jgi:selenocysteine lyase/cysteine desulfurase